MDRSGELGGGGEKPTWAARMTLAINHIAIAGLILLAACGSRGRSIRPDSFDGQDYRVEVSNQNFYSATIYAYRDGYRRRLGDVGANRTSAFTFAWPFPEVRFQIDFLAAGCIFSEVIQLVDGDRLSVWIQPADHRRASRSLCGG